MATGTTLVNLRKMLNGELEDELDETIASAGVDTKNQKLNNMQSFLYGQHNFLRGKVRVSLPLTPGQRYYTLPAGIDFDHLDKPQYTTVAGFRYEVYFGIDQPEYNVYRSDLGVQATPVIRWDLVNVAGVLQIECWPIPSTIQTLEFSGQNYPTPMVADSDPCVIDDLLIVLFTAAEMLAKRQAADASAKLAKANAHLASIRSGKPSKHEMFQISGAEPIWSDRYGRRRPVTGVTVATNP